MALTLAQPRNKVVVYRWSWIDPETRVWIGSRYRVWSMGELKPSPEWAPPDMTAFSWALVHEVRQLGGVWRERIIVRPVGWELECRRDGRLWVEMQWMSSPARMVKGDLCWR